MNKKEEIIQEILKKSGLNITHLWNSGYLVDKMDTIDNNLPIQEQVDLYLKNLGFKETNAQYNFDSYYGLLTDFAWNDISHERGLHLTHLNYQINKLIILFPADKEQLFVIKRRLNYIYFLENEIKYILKRYDFERISIMNDWLINKFERYSTLIAELCLLIFEYSNPGNIQLNFTDLLNKIYHKHDIFKNVNSVIHAFIIITLRNEIVHSTSGYKIEQIQNDDFLINIKGVKVSKYNYMNKYINDVYSYGKDKCCDRKISIIDYRFPYIEVDYRKTKNGHIDCKATKINVVLDLKQYIKITHIFINLLANTLFEELINSNSDSVK